MVVLDWLAHLHTTARPWNQGYRDPSDFQGSNCQVNVYNVLNDGPLDPVRLSATPDFYFPGGETATSRGIGYSWLNVVEPRSFRFTTTFDF